MLPFSFLLRRFANVDVGAYSESVHFCTLIPLNSAGMRKAQHRDIYAKALMRCLQDAELRALLPDLQRCAGSHALLVAPDGGEPPPALPLLACWTELRVLGTRYSGHLHGATDEPLPFVDDAFDVVWLRHALELTPLSGEILREAVRVLAPGGTLVVGGIHPFGAWAPWFHWSTRGGGYKLHAPLQLAYSLRRAALDVVSTRRVGCLWPTAKQGGAGGGSVLWGGGYVLLARKQRSLVTPLRTQPELLLAPTGRLSPSARHSAIA